MKYPLFKVKINSEVAIANLKKVIDSGYVNEGESVTEFATLLSGNLGVRNLVLMNSCTSALTVAYKIAGVGPNTEVISTPMTCIATNTPIVNLGAKIVWADVNPSTGNISVESIENRITSMTAAIAYVDWAGNPAELEAIQELGNRYKIPVIQDAAHAYGAKWRGQSIADFADFTCFSFQAIKHLSSGDGGALVCRDDSSYNLAKKLKWFGYDRDATKDEKGNWKGQRWEADILEGEVGYKFNMNNLAAAVGLAGMDSIDTVLDQHRANANILIELLGNSELFEVIPLPKHAQSSYWVFTILTNLSKEKRDELLLRLNSAGVEAGLVHLPNDTYSAFRTSKMSLPGVRSFSERQISLPCGWWLTNDDCRKIGEITLRIASDLA